ncbi:TIGR03086 family metal-binding protein [Micromonospora sp. NPDC005324]|uniref:TIGR03086 family metal-binding protein n=1 Tax=Micromonospora sp. NPDC005324 TaxID=3157033 RepID=UPI00339F618E
MITNFPDVRTADETTVRASITVVQRVSAADLDKPTPCPQWRLGDLLAHMTAQHHGFAAAATGRGSDAEMWRTRPSADPVRAYLTAAEGVLAAFATDEVLDREFALPEVDEVHTIPGRMAVSFHFIDYVVHGWDVARSLGVAWNLPDEVLRAALPIARAVPDDATRLAPGAAFAPRLPERADDDLLGRILAVLGRSPDWPHA